MRTIRLVAALAVLVVLASCVLVTVPATLYVLSNYTTNVIGFYYRVSGTLDWDSNQAVPALLPGKTLGPFSLNPDNYDLMAFADDGTLWTLDDQTMVSGTSLTWQLSP